MLNRFFSILFLLSVVWLSLHGCTDPTTETVAEKEPPQQALPTPDQDFGVNVNGQYDLMKFDNLERTQTQWVRGFIDVLQLFPDEHRLESSQRIKNYLQLKEEGYKTILNLKWNFSNRSFPERSSEEMADYTAYLQKLLDTVWNSTDIIVIGNEPYIESRPEERRAELLDFYKEVAYVVKTYRANHSKEVPIFVGAFNNLYLEGWQTDSVEELLAFAEKTSWIAGIDLHIHHSAISQLNTAMDFVEARIRANQQILVTEFSLMKHWRTKMKETIPEAFAGQYTLEPETTNHEYLDKVLKEPVSKEEWDQFLSGSYWFQNRRAYLWNAYQRFKSYEQFHVATYALRQSFPFDRAFTASIDPWILNGLFANRTVQPDVETGLDAYNYAWIEDFKRIRKDN